MSWHTNPLKSLHDIQGKRYRYVVIVVGGRLLSGTRTKRDVFHSLGTYCEHRLRLNRCVKILHSSVEQVYSSLGLMASGPTAFPDVSRSSSNLTWDGWRIIGAAAGRGGGGGMGWFGAVKSVNEPVQIVRQILVTIRQRTTLLLHACDLLLSSLNLLHSILLQLLF